MKVQYLDLKALYVELKGQCDTAFQRIMEFGEYIIVQEFDLLIDLHLHKTDAQRVVEILLEVFKYDII